MKTEISRDSHQPKKRYSGVYQQQGRMLTDADWNELVDILKGRLNDALKDIIGCREGGIGGTPRHRALQVIKNLAADPLTIQPGHVYVDGVAAQVPGDTAIAYAMQPDFPTPPALINDCVLYADVWERTVTQLTDPRLRDQGLHGADTCTRKEVMAQIKWCPATIEPEVASENPYKGDAKATITLLKKSDQPDPCDPCVEELELESRVGNYLFRVEVHEVKGPANNPTEITFKWSAENGAIECGLIDAEAPEYFTAGDWAFEYFDETSERHLGVHLAGGWSPTRGILKKTYAKPTGAGDPKAYVRRWNGYCTLVKSGGSWNVSDQYDKDFKDSSFATTAGNKLTIKIYAQTIVIELNQTIVTGDFWLADVREAAHKDGDVLLTAGLPCGIEHRYLKLGKVVGGKLQDNQEADRKFAFPPLTEMTRMFIAGGDGQEVVPGDPLNPLPQPLRIAVANGEWPVAGAKVRFHTNTGSLVPADGIVTSAADGIAKCIWIPGGIAISPPGSKPKYEVKVTLIDPDDVSKDLTHPPVYFFANLITADQVAYEPQCLPDNNVATVHHLLLGPDAVRLGTDGYYTVKEVLDALLCELKADHLPYDEPACTGTGDPSVKSLLAGLDINGDGHLTVKDVLDTLLCKLRANHIPFYPVDCAAGDLMPTVKTGLAISANTTVHDVLQKLICQLDAGVIPYDPTAQGGRWSDILDASAASPTTVQAAIDELVAWLESTDINYLIPDCASSPSVRSLLMSDWDTPAEKTQKIDAVFNKLLCEFRATHLPLDKTDPKLCSDLAEADSVQDALKILCDRKAGGGCALTVGAGGQFLTLEEVLKYCEKNEMANICICILPADPKGKGLILTDNLTIFGTGAKEPSIFQHIKITGCAGAVITTDKFTITFDGLESVVIRDVTFTGGKTAAKQLDFANCREVELSSCHLEGYVRDSALVSVSEADRIILAHNNIAAYSVQVLKNIGTIFKAVDLGISVKIAEVFQEDLLNKALFEQKLTRIAPIYEKLKPAELEGFLSGVRQVLGNPETHKVLPTTGKVRLAFDQFIGEASSKPLETARFLDILEIIREAAVKEARDAAVAVMDGQAVTLLDHNVIAGDVCIYGERPSDSFDQAMKDKLLPLLKDSAPFIPSTGTLTLCDNHMHSLRLGVSKYGEIVGLADGKTPKVAGLFEIAQLNNNRFDDINNQLVAQRVSVTANYFSESGPVGAVLAETATYTGNIGPTSKGYVLASILNISIPLAEAGNLVQIK